MTVLKKQMDTVNTTKPGAILLLGDDGRMSHLLAQRFAEVAVDIEGDVLKGIAQLSRHDYGTVLVHSGAVEKDAAQAVRALRRLAPHARLLLYGEPYTEVFSRLAVEAGADDYLIWPVPAGQLGDALRGGERSVGRAWGVTRRVGLGGDSVYGAASSGEAASGAAKDGFAPAATEPAAGDIDPALLSRYRDLAQLIPQGRTKLLEQAGELAGELLGVEWVDICVREAGDERAEAGDVEGTRGRAEAVVPLREPGGAIGELRLGPARRGVRARPAMAQHFADFLATLLSLAQRDETLKHLATVDELTGAYNRRYLEYFLREVIEQSKHEHTQVTLLMFDIDEFKHYNDTYGHLAGDEVLRECYKLMRRCCRTHDVVARMGGDEFAVLFWDTGQPRPVYRREEGGGEGMAAPSTTAGTNRCEATRAQTPLRGHPEVALFLSNRFRRMLKTNEVPSLGPEARGTLAISGGLACFPWDGSTVQELLAKADEALLTAKRSGKNRIYLVGQPESV